MGGLLRSRRQIRRASVGKRHATWELLRCRHHGARTLVAGEGGSRFAMGTRSSGKQGGKKGHQKGMPKGNVKGKGWHSSTVIATIVECRATRRIGVFWAVFCWVLQGRQGMGKSTRRHQQRRGVKWARRARGWNILRVIRRDSWVWGRFDIDGTPERPLVSPPGTARSRTRASALSAASRVQLSLVAGRTSTQTDSPGRVSCVACGG